MPDGPDPDPPLWTLPINLLSLVAIVVACVALFRGSRRAPELGILAGLGMVAETVTCPVTGHHLLGSFVWTQTGLSAFVLLASTALVATRPVPRDG